MHAAPSMLCPGRVTSRCLSLHGGLIIHSDGAEPADGGTQMCSGAVISSPAVNKSEGEAKKTKQLLAQRFRFLVTRKR